MNYNETKNKLYEQTGTPGSSQGANAGKGKSAANYDAMRNSLYRDIGVKTPKRYTQKSYRAADFEAARGRAALWERQFRNVVEDMAQNGATEESRKRFEYLQSTYLDIAQSLSWNDIKPFSQLGESMTRVRQFLAADGWMNRYNDVMQGVSEYDKKRAGGYTRDASGGYGEEIDSLISDYEGIKSYPETKQYYDALTELKSSIRAIDDSMAQFKDEDDFNRYTSYWQDQEEKRNFDLVAGQQEIDALQKQIDEMEYDWTDYAQRVAAEKKVTDLQRQIDEKKWYLDEAKRVQEEYVRSGAAFRSKSGYEDTIGLSDYRQASGLTGFAKTAKSGYQQYLENQAAAAEDKRKTQEWLSRPHPGVSGMEMAALGLATDDTYKQPDERWTQEQRDVYGVLYRQDKKKAEQFAIDTNNAYNSAEQEQQREDAAAFAREHPVLSTAGSLFAGATGLGMADFLGSGIEKFARGTITQKGFVSPHQAAETATGEISQNLNDQYGTISEDIPVLGGHGLGDAYQLMNSIITSAATANTVGPLGTDIIFFGNAAASAMYDAKKRNATDEESLLMGLISGTAEAAGEHFSASHLLEMTDSRTIKKFFSSLFGQAMEEGEEELFTSFVNNLADNYVMHDKSNFYQYVDAYMQNNPGVTLEKAKKEAWKQMWSDMAFDALGGFVSGGAHTVGQVGINRVASNSAYKSTYGDSSAELVQQGLESPEGSEGSLMMGAGMLMLKQMNILSMG